MPDPQPWPSAEPIAFTDREIRLIDISLPEKTDLRRRGLLPKVLRAWGMGPCREHLSQAPPETIALRVKTLRSIAQRADLLAAQFEALDEIGLTELALASANPLNGPAGYELDAVTRIIRDEPEWLRLIASLARQASSSWERGRGRPQNLKNYLILQDLAAIFEWVTRQKATRKIDRKEGKDIGPFWDFTAAVWPIIFDSDDGLSYGLKSWAVARRNFHETSLVLVNLALRHPSWRLFDD